MASATPSHVKNSSFQDTFLLSYCVIFYEQIYNFLLALCAQDISWLKKFAALCAAVIIKTWCFLLCESISCPVVQSDIFFQWFNFLPSNEHNVLLTLWVPYFRLIRQIYTSMRLKLTIPSHSRINWMILPSKMFKNQNF